MSTQNSAIADRCDDLNDVASFDALLSLEQDALRLWVRLALEPARNIGGRFSDSYGLKHYAEDALGWYVSNGQLKGAMLAEGYRWRQREGTPNWLFNVRRRCPHGMVGDFPYDRHFGCPTAEQRPHRYADTFPALCRASADELRAFDRARIRALSERLRVERGEA